MRSPTRVLSSPVDPRDDGVGTIDRGRGMASPLHLPKGDPQNHWTKRVKEGNSPLLSLGATSSSVGKVARLPWNRQAVLLDPQGACHAVGVILDGTARSDCTPSRGSRDNSAIRYVGSTDTPRLAVVVSDDGTVDVVPLLRPRIRPSAIESTISAQRGAPEVNSG